MGVYGRLVADWDHDGLADIVLNSIWGKIEWYKNIGTALNPILDTARTMTVAWRDSVPKPAWNWWDPLPGQLITQWRTTPFVTDWNKDGLNDLIMLDHQGYLAFFERAKEGGQLILLPGKRIFTAASASVADNQENAGNQIATLLQLNNGQAGKSGRRKFCLTDWDGDGQIDLLVNSRNIDLFRGQGYKNDRYHFIQTGALDTTRLAGHTTSPTIVDWNKDDIPDLLIGAEDGCFYYLKNPRR